MDSTRRWIVIGVIVLIIALLWLFWPKSGEKPAPAVAPVAAPAPATPAPAKPEGPTTVTVLFEYDSTALRAAESAKLDAFAKGAASGGIRAVGHADRIGSDSYNMDLSRKRAEAVRSHLVGKGVEAGRVRAEAKGESEAATGAACQKLGAENRANRKLVECLQPDRRVEVTLASRP